MPSMLAAASCLYSASFGGTDAAAGGAAGRSLWVAREVVVASDATSTNRNHARRLNIIALSCHQSWPSAGRCPPFRHTQKRGQNARDCRRNHIGTRSHGGLRRTHST